MQENVFENVVCKIAAILFIVLNRPQKPPQSEAGAQYLPVRAAFLVLFQEHNTPNGESDYYQVQHWALDNTSNGLPLGWGPLERLEMADHRNGNVVLSKFWSLFVPEAV